jgi:hypothetical protein
MADCYVTHIEMTLSVRFSKLHLNSVTVLEVSYCISMLDRYSKDILLCSLKDIKPEAGSVCRSEWTVQWKLNFIPTVT